MAHVKWQGTSRTFAFEISSTFLLFAFFVYLADMKRAFHKIRDLLTRGRISAVATKITASSAPESSRNIDLSDSPIVAMSSLTYIIKAGDTLVSITAQLGISVAFLQQANPSVIPDKMEVGQVLQLQAGGSQYTIQAGDTFESIASKFGSTVAILEAANPSVEPSKMVVGAQVSIPSNATSPVAQSPVPIPTTYTIIPGDTFEAIAMKLGTTVIALENANPSVNERNLQVGSQLIVPNTTAPSPTLPPLQPKLPVPIAPPTGTYTIQGGDTFESIAGKLGITVGTLQGLNVGINERTLQIGSQIIVPASTQPAVIPAPVVIPVPAPLPTPASNPAGTYTIQAGDTFTSIAAKVGTTIEILQTLNPSIEPKNLQIGTSLTLPSPTTPPPPTSLPAPAPLRTPPSPRTHTVQPGDNLSSIASSYSIPLEDLKAANPSIVSPFIIQVGQLINLPSNASTTPNPVQQQPEVTIPNIVVRPVVIVEGPGTGSSVGGGYVEYSGPASRFPDPSTWASYSHLLASATSLINRFSGNTPLETSYIASAITRVSQSSGVDPRVILCVIIQESAGKVRVPNTYNGVVNTGIMQAFNGGNFVGDQGEEAKRESIWGMVRDGVEGTYYKVGGGPGLIQAYAQTKNWYSAARIYNSGTENPTEMNDARGATGHYVTHLANRLMGHVWAGM